MSGMVLATESVRSRSHDGANLEGGRCDGSEEGGSIVAQEAGPASQGRLGDEEGTERKRRPRRRRPRPSRPRRPRAGPPKARRRSHGPEEGCVRRPKAAPAEKKKAPVAKEHGDQGGVAGQEGRRPASMQAPAKKKAVADQERGPRRLRSGPPSVRTPRTPSSSTSSGPCCSRSVPSTAGRRSTCGPRPTRWPSSVNRAMSSSTRSRVRAARSPSTGNATWRSRPRPPRRWRRSTTPSGRSTGRATGAASDAIRPSRRPGSGRCRSPGCAWPARAVACHVADR